MTRRRRFLGLAFAAYHSYRNASMGSTRVRVVDAGETSFRLAEQIRAEPVSDLQHEIQPLL